MAASEFSSLPRPEQEKLLSLLFEHSQVFLDYVLPVCQEPAQSWEELIERIRGHLRTMLKTPDDERIPGIIAAHPRLGAKKVDSALSQAEQASLQTASARETEQLAELNAEYERTFPGLRYVVFVAGRPRSVIMDDMRERIAKKDIEAEKRTAFDAMCDIALDRVAGLGDKI
ncbi:hypothetical protein B9G98_04705 [Wickerhamiella sorbophila]|uniref:Oxo-4-hydroxy-4-carboxy-5-ureidoimidazoline decarboxylase domain-containing protein n=1 Tax=Wickerhamiella sorbophila TaxID=45607 RepID=A0A2T0FQ28_9ASCO|nr:hypothetical protein B9G98_04705 [Wickerhamiella sorbophila]PRT57085.1 hypothetical protein B9G98_04705 [Wickerhamiella sorbophila]